MDKRTTTNQLKKSFQIIMDFVLPIFFHPPNMTSGTTATVTIFTENDTKIEPQPNTMNIYMRIIQIEKIPSTQEAKEVKKKTLSRIKHDLQNSNKEIR